MREPSDRLRQVNASRLRRTSRPVVPFHGESPIVFQPMPTPFGRRGRPRCDPGGRPTGCLPAASKRPTVPRYSVRSCKAVGSPGRRRSDVRHSPRCAPPRGEHLRRSGSRDESQAAGRVLDSRRLAQALAEGARTSGLPALTMRVRSGSAAPRMRVRLCGVRGP